MSSLERQYATSPRFESIQLLRFLAAFAVVVCHGASFTATKFPIDSGIVELLGWMGGWSVTLFFCISGFVITHSAQPLNSGQFLLHRLSRIYPAYWLATIAVCVVKLALFGGLPTSELSVLSATLLPVGERPYPLWIEWSLVYEVFFYLLFSAIWLTRSNRAVLVLASVWLATIIVVAILHPGWAAGERYPTLGKILFSSRNIPFIFGIFCYYLRAYFTPSVRAILIALFPAGLAGIVAFQTVDFVDFSSAVAAFALLAFVVSTPMQPKRDSLMVKLGDFSYGIYLVHISTITVLLSVGFKHYQNPWIVLVAVIAAGTGAGALFGAFEMAIYKRIKRRLDAHFGSTRKMRADESGTAVATR